MQKEDRRRTATSIYKERQDEGSCVSYRQTLSRQLMSPLIRCMPLIKSNLEKKIKIRKSNWQNFLVGEAGRVPNHQTWIPLNRSGYEWVRKLTLITSIIEEIEAYVYNSWDELAKLILSYIQNLENKLKWVIESGGELCPDHIWEILILFCILFTFLFCLVV